MQREGGWVQSRGWGKRKSERVAVTVGHERLQEVAHLRHFLVELLGRLGVHEVVVMTMAVMDCRGMGCYSSVLLLLRNGEYAGVVSLSFSLSLSLSFFFFSLSLCMCACVRVCVCACVRVCVRMHVCMYVCVRTRA